VTNSIDKSHDLNIVFGRIR